MHHHCNNKWVGFAGGFKWDYIRSLVGPPIQSIHSYIIIVIDCEIHAMIIAHAYKDS